MKNYEDDEIWTVKEAADYLKVSPYCLRELCRKKQIPHFRVGDKLIRFTGAEIKKWKAKQEYKNFR